MRGGSGAVGDDGAEVCVGDPTCFSHRGLQRATAGVGLSAAFNKEPQWGAVAL